MIPHGDEDLADFEVLTTQAWRIPRWLVAVLAVLAVIGTATALVRAAGGRPTRPTAAAASQTSARPSAPPRQGPPALLGTHWLDLGGGQPVDLALGTRHAFVLAALPSELRTVMKMDLRGQVEQTVVVPVGASQLAVDEDDDRLWLVVSDDRGDTVLDYDSSTLRYVSALPVPARVWGAVALDGRLWLASERGLYSLDHRVHALARAPVTCGCTAIAADAENHRVIVTIDAWPARVIGYRPADRTMLTGPSLDVGKTSLAAVHGVVWVAGYGRDRLVKLNPITLRRDGYRPPSDLPGPGMTVWPGTDVIWVGGDGGGMSCVDRLSGAPLSTLAAGSTGPVVSRDGIVFVVVLGQLGRVRASSACSG